MQQKPRVQRKIPTAAPHQGIVAWCWGFGSLRLRMCKNHDNKRWVPITCLRSTSIVAAHVAPDCQVTPPLAATPHCHRRPVAWKVPLPASAAASLIVIASLWHGKRGRLPLNVIAGLWHRKRGRLLQQPDFDSLRKIVDFDPEEDGLHSLWVQGPK